MKRKTEKLECHGEKGARGRSELRESACCMRSHADQCTKRAVVDAEAIAPEGDSMPDLFLIFVSLYRSSTVTLHGVAGTHEGPATSTLMLCGRHCAILLLKLDHVNAIGASAEVESTGILVSHLCCLHDLLRVDDVLHGTVVRHF